MSRVALFGVGPLPLENPERIHGTSLRAWHFARPLAEAGHEVHLLAMHASQHSKDIETAEIGGVHYTSVDEVEHFHSDAFLREYLLRVAPDCIVGVNLFPALRACQCAGELPVWADLNGFALGEAQMKSAQANDDFYVSHFWNYERGVLLRADHFSTCSTPQMYTLVGELALAGRLNATTATHSMIDVIPNARANVPLPTTRGTLRGKIVPGDAFIVLWAGGYNVWLDGATMLDLLLRVMDEHPGMYYVSTGGTLDGYDEETYPAFKGAAEGSRHAERFRFLDWIPSQQLPGCYCDADVGISVDLSCYESLIGARNRLTDMLQYGLPVLCTLAPEISHGIERAGAGLTFACGDAAAGAHALLELALDADMRDVAGRNARKLYLEAYTDTITVAPVAAWCDAPARAPDADHPRGPLAWHEPPARPWDAIRSRVRRLHPEA